MDVTHSIAAEYAGRLFGRQSWAVKTVLEHRGLTLVEVAALGRGTDARLLLVVCGGCVIDQQPALRPARKVQPPMDASYELTP